MRYCPNCKQMVRPVKSGFSWGVFLLCLGIFYLPYHWWIKPRKYCPICGSRVQRRKPAESIN